jgi:hypothetical protein
VIHQVGNFPNRSPFVPGSTWLLDEFGDEWLASISIGSVNDVFDPALRDNEFGCVHVEGASPVSFENFFGVRPSGKVEVASSVDAIDVHEGVSVG